MDIDRREDKGRPGGLGDVLDYRTNHLAAIKDVLNKSFWENIHFAIGRWFGVV